VTVDSVSRRVVAWAMAIDSQTDPQTLSARTSFGGTRGMVVVGQAAHAFPVSGGVLLGWGMPPNAVELNNERLGAGGGGWVAIADLEPPVANQYDA